MNNLDLTESTRKMASSAEVIKPQTRRRKFDQVDILSQKEWEEESIQSLEKTQKRLNIKKNNATVKIEEFDQNNKKLLHNVLKKIPLVKKKSAETFMD